MIVKMKFLSITGPKADIDRVVNTYLSKYEIHLENALTELSTMQNITPYIQINPYKETLKQAEDFTALLPEEKRTTTKRLSLEDAINCVHGLDHTLGQLNQERTELEAKKKDLMEKAQKIEPFQDLHCNLSSILDFHFIKFRFGKITKEYYNKFESYCYENSDTVFYRCHSDEQYVWGIYFCPRDQVTKVDAVFSSLHFERIYVPDEYSGTPEDAYAALQAEIKKTDDALSECSRKLAKCLSDSAEDLVAAKEQLEQLSGNFDVRRLAACTKSKKETFYILCGWMSEKDAASFQKDIENDTNLFCFIEDDANNVLRQPPTKLKNNFLFRPFEPIVTMYGLPSYNEIDPTPLIAVIYCLMTGFMFGDVGQGLVFAIAGLILLRRKSMLAGVFLGGGLCAMIFGFLYGSIFSMEDVIKPIFMNPMESANINTMLIIGIAIGVVLLVLGMVLNILNGIKAKDKGRIFFDRNGIAGMVFYLLIIGSAVGFLLNGKLWVSAGLLAGMILIPFVIIFFKHPLENLLNKKKALPAEKGSFFIETAFEMVDMLLSFASNTISFVRLSAFAINHVGLSMAFLILSDLTSGAGKVIIMIIGNALIIGLEGLIVGIQGLRLVYYELFSRFYSGDGVPYTPVVTKNKN